MLAECCELLRLVPMGEHTAATQRVWTCLLERRLDAQTMQWSLDAEISWPSDLQRETPLPVALASFHQNLADLM